MWEVKDEKVYVFKICVLMLYNISSPFPCTVGTTAPLSAAFGGSVLVVKILVEEFGSSIDEEAYVSVCTLRPMCSKIHLRH